MISIAFGDGSARFSVKYPTIKNTCKICGLMASSMDLSLAQRPRGLHALFFFFPPMKTHACLELLNRMLALMQPGSFIIRFSERNAGQLVVVYKNGKEEVRYDTLHPLSLTPLKHTMHVITTNLWLQALSGY